MDRVRWILLVGLLGCQVTAPSADPDVIERPAPEARPEPPAAPDPMRPEPDARPSTLELPDDQHCGHRRQTRPDVSRTGDPSGAMMVEYLDDEGCVAVRSTRTISGRTTRIEVEVPGDPQWFPQPPAYVDATPRPQVTTVTVDAQGREVERTIDLDADGTIDDRVRQVWQGDRLLAQVREGAHPFSQRWTYDARGNEVRVETEDAHHHSVVERVFDAQDRSVSERVFRDGALSTTRTRRYAGEHLLEDRFESVGRVEETIYTYDADGALRRREWRRGGGATVIIETHDFSVNAAGERVEHYQRDDRGDGDIDEQRWTTYDADGRVRLLQTDANADGTVDWRREQRWDAEGRLVWWRNVQDGAQVLLRTWTFGAVYEHTEWPVPNMEGTRVTRTWQDGDDTISEVTLQHRGERLLSRTVTRYVTPDVIGEELTDRDGDGTVDLHLRQTVDAWGRLTRVDWTRDGVVTWRTLEYDRHGEVATEIGTLPAGGEAHLLRHVVRDAAGNILYSHALRRDGESAFRIVYAFD